jgi:hypothetical protein
MLPAFACASERRAGRAGLRAYVLDAAQEAMAMAAAGMHANVVRYYGAWTEDAPGEAGRHVYILMEPCAESLGMRRIVCKAPLREAELLDVLRQARPPRRGPAGAARQSSGPSV